MTFVLQGTRRAAWLRKRCAEQPCGVAQQVGALKFVPLVLASGAFVTRGQPRPVVIVCSSPFRGCCECCLRQGSHAFAASVEYVMWSSFISADEVQLPHNERKRRWSYMSQEIPQTLNPKPKLQTSSRGERMTVQLESNCKEHSIVL